MGIPFGRQEGTWCREQQLLFRPGRTEARLYRRSCGKSVCLFGGMCFCDGLTGFVVMCVFLFFFTGLILVL